MSAENRCKPSHPFKRNSYQFFLQVIMMRRSLRPQLNFPSKSQPISCLAQLNRLPSVATPRSGWMAGFLAGDWCMWIVARCTKHRAMSLNISEDRSENPATKSRSPRSWKSSASCGVKFLVFLAIQSGESLSGSKWPSRKKIFKAS